MTAGQQLGALLIDMGFIDEAQLESALDEQSRTGKRLGRILVRAGIITEERLVHALSRQLGIEPCDPIMTPIHARVLALVPPALAFKHHVLPIARQREETRDCLYVATSDPLDKNALQALRAVVGTNTRVRWMLAGETEMELALARHYGAPPRPTSDIPVIQGRPVSGPVDRSSAFVAPSTSATPARGQSTEDIAAALSVAMGERPLPAERLQSLGSRDLLPLTSGEVSDDILVAEDVVESGAFPAVNDLRDAVHRPAEMNLDDALAAAFAEEMGRAPPPIETQGTQQSGLATSSPLGGRDPADQAIDDAFAGFGHDGATSEDAAVDAALAGVSTDASVRTNAPTTPDDDDMFPPPDGGAFDEAFDAGFAPQDAYDARADSYPRANGAPAPVEPVEALEPEGASAEHAPSAAPMKDEGEAPTSIPAPTAPEPAAHEVDTGPSWGDLLDTGSAWSGSLVPSSSVTTPPEDVEIPEPADSSLPTMLAEPAESSAGIAEPVPEVDAAPDAPDPAATDAAAPIEASPAVEVDSSTFGVEAPAFEPDAFDAEPATRDAEPPDAEPPVAAETVAFEDSGGLDAEPPGAESPVADAEPPDAELPVVEAESFADESEDVALDEIDADVTVDATPGAFEVEAPYEVIDVEEDAEPEAVEAPRVGGLAEAFGLGAPEPADAPDDSDDAPLPIGPDALAAAERALHEGAPPDDDDLPDASADIELAGAPTGAGLFELVARFAEGASLEDEELQLMMRALAAALLELGAFDDDRLEAITRRLGLD